MSIRKGNKLVAGNPNATEINNIVDSRISSALSSVAQQTTLEEVKSISAKQTTLEDFVNLAAKQETLEELKTLINSKSGGNSYPNVSSGTVNSESTKTITGKGKISMWVLGSWGQVNNVEIDGVSMSGYINIKDYSYQAYVLQFSFENSFKFTAWNSTIYYLVQLSD